tara:strand:+ start:1678 stop:1860 length:183 start_codon:yes stop_codon:yes gene_type:complete
MIIMMGGIPTSGKSTIARNILKELGSAVNVEPLSLFPCEKRGDSAGKLNAKNKTGVWVYI